MPKISGLKGKKILDSRNQPTLEIGLILDNGIEVAVSLPQGVSQGKHEAVYLAPEKAIENLKEKIEPAVTGMEVDEQENLDKRLLELDGTKNKSELGANAILGVSLAAARASAKSAKIPLWQRFREIYGLKVSTDRTPRLFVNVMEGGLHSKGNLPFQEYLVIPKTDSMARAAEMGGKIHTELKKYLRERFGESGTELGDEGGFDAKFESELGPFEALSELLLKMDLAEKIDFGLDAAASNIKIPAKELFPIYELMNNRFKMFYLEDPFGEDDWDNFSEILGQIGKDTIIAGDDLTVTSPERMQEAREKNCLNGVVVKPNQIGTVIETIQVVRQAREWDWAVIVSHRGGETMDDFIADLAFGVAADGFKLGAPSRPERLVKYQRLLAIEEEAWHV